MKAVESQFLKYFHKLGIVLAIGIILMTEGDTIPKLEQLLFQSSNFFPKKQRLVYSFVETVLLENVFQEARKELGKRTVLVEHWLGTDPQ